MTQSLLTHATPDSPHYFVRLRVDLLQTGSAPLRADVQLATHLSVAEAICELLAVFPQPEQPELYAHESDIPLAEPNWQLRLPNGQLAPLTSTIEELQPHDGDRWELHDHPAVIHPLITDISDELAHNVPDPKLSDSLVARIAALSATTAIAVALLLFSYVHPLATSGIALALTLVIFVNLWFELNKPIRGRRSSYLPTLLIQLGILGLATTTCLAGIPLVAKDIPTLVLLTFPSLYLGLSGGAVITGLAVLSLNGLASSNTTCLAVATTLLCFGVNCGVFAGLLALNSQDLLTAAAFALLIALIELTFAPSLAVMASGIRVPRIPAAGESFAELNDDSDDPLEDTLAELDDEYRRPSPAATSAIQASAPDDSARRATLARRAGAIIDGLIAALALVLALLVVLILASEFSKRSCALAVVLFVLFAIQSRSHARFVPSLALAVGAIAVLFAVCVHLWLLGFGLVALALLLPLFVAPVLLSLPTRQVTPTLRRTLELCEAIALAIAFPLAAALAGVISTIQQVMN